MTELILIPTDSQDDTTTYLHRDIPAKLIRIARHRAAKDSIGWCSTYVVEGYNVELDQWEMVEHGIMRVSRAHGDKRIAMEYTPEHSYGKPYRIYAKNRHGYIYIMEELP